MSNALMNAIAIALHYIFLGLIYFFLWKVLLFAWRSLRTAGAPEAREAVLDQDPPGRMEATLEVITSGSALPHKVYTFTDSLSIGRSETNDVVVNEPFVSAEHACLTLTKQECLLTDLASTNGTYLNDRQVEGEAALQPGDLIKIGSAIFKFMR